MELWICFRTKFSPFTNYWLQIQIKDKNENFAAWSRMELNTQWLLNDFCTDKAHFFIAWLPHNAEQSCLVDMKPSWLPNQASAFVSCYSLVWFPYTFYYGPFLFWGVYHSSEWKICAVTVDRYLPICLTRLCMHFIFYYEILSSAQTYAWQLLKKSEFILKYWERTCALKSIIFLIIIINILF